MNQRCDKLAEIMTLYTQIFPPNTIEGSKSSAPNPHNDAAVLWQFCSSDAIVEWKKLYAIGSVATLPSSYRMTTTRMTFDLKTNFTVLLSFATVHMHSYLNALAIPAQRSRNPTIKIENSPNLLQFFKIF